MGYYDNDRDYDAANDPRISPRDREIQRYQNSRRVDQWGDHPDGDDRNWVQRAADEVGSWFTGSDSEYDHDRRGDRYSSNNNRSNRDDRNYGRDDRYRNSGSYDGDRNQRGFSYDESYYGSGIDRGTRGTEFREPNRNSNMRNSDMRNSDARYDSRGYGNNYRSDYGRREDRYGSSEHSRYGDSRNDEYRRGNGNRGDRNYDDGRSGRWDTRHVNTSEYGNDNWNSGRDNSDNDVDYNSRSGRDYNRHYGNSGDEAEFGYSLNPGGNTRRSWGSSDMGSSSWSRRD